MATATATLIGYNGYNSGWYRNATSLKTNFYTDSWGRTDYNGLAHEYGAGDYCYVIAFTLPLGTYNAPALTMSNLGYAKPWSTDRSNFTCYWAISDSGPVDGKKSVQGNILLKGSVSISGLKYNWSTSDEAYIKYPNSYTTDSNSTTTFTVTSNTKYYYFWLYSGNAVRVGFWQPTIQLNNYSPPTYTVSYDANGGSGAPSSQSKTHDVALTLSSTRPTKANIAAGSYTVELDDNGGTCSTDSVSASRTTSYSFTNWKATNGTTYNPGGSYTANAATTMTAQWSQATTTGSVTLPVASKNSTTSKCFVNFDANGGSCSVSQLEATRQTTYTHIGWYTRSSGGSKISSPYTPTGNITLYAQFSSSTGQYSSVSLPTPTRTGYIFKGWSTNQKATSGSTTTYKPTGTTTLYAIWESIKYTVKYILDGGILSGGRATQETVSYNNFYYLIQRYEISKPGYYLERWTTNSNRTDDGYNWTYPDGTIWGVKNQTKWGVTANTYGVTESNTITFYPKWLAHTYQVSYNANGGEGTMQPSDHTYDIAKNLNTNSFTKTGYQFIGWNTQSDGSGASYNNNQSVLNLTANNGATIILYAQWELISSRVIYQREDETRLGETSVIWGSEFTADTFDINKTGYLFDGWIDSLGARWTLKSNGMPGQPAWQWGYNEPEVILTTVWKPRYNIIVYKDGEWKKLTPIQYKNGQWKKLLPMSLKN